MYNRLPSLAEKEPEAFEPHPLNGLVFRAAPALSLNTQPIGDSSDSFVEVDWAHEIQRIWAQGQASTFELAKVLSAARRSLPYGGWSRLCNSGQLPFSKRKAEMLVVIGEGLGGIDAQTFAHLPRGWSIVHILAQLDRVVNWTVNVSKQKSKDANPLVSNSLHRVPSFENYRYSISADAPTIL